MTTADLTFDEFVLETPHHLYQPDTDVVANALKAVRARVVAMRTTSDMYDATGNFVFVAWKKYKQHDGGALHYIKLIYKYGDETMQPRDGDEDVDQCILEAARSTREHFYSASESADKFMHDILHMLRTE